jgi:hypothetical protein
MIDLLRRALQPSGHVCLPPNDYIKLYVYSDYTDPTTATTICYTRLGDFVHILVWYVQ